MALFILFGRHAHVERNQRETEHMSRNISLIVIALIVVVAMAMLFSSRPEQQSSSYEPGRLTEDQILARDIFGELIEIDTTSEHGSTTVAANAMADRLLAAGFPAEDIKVLEEVPGKGNLVARLRGSGEREPLLLLAHLDVVEALPGDWSLDPFTFTEQDDFYYGRGTTDDKAQAAIWVANLIRMKQEAYIPNRDVIVALTADEEGGDHNGVQWLLANHRDLIEAEYALNEGGTGAIVDGEHIFNAIQVSEKIYQSFELRITNPGGHSARPTPDNAIYHLARALLKISNHQFPLNLNDGTRLFFERMALINEDATGADMKALLEDPPDPDAVSRLSVLPALNSIMRTTCVATQLAAGHAENALPQLATAVVNCRILPDESPDDIRQVLIDQIDDARVSVTPINEPTPSDPSPLTPEILQAVESITTQMWPGVVVVPTMNAGATDGLYLRNAGIPTYGVSGIFRDVDDVRAHGKDERILIRSYFEGQAFLYRLVAKLSSGQEASPTTPPPTTPPPTTPQPTTQ